MNKPGEPVFLPVNTLLLICFAASAVLFVTGLFLPLSGWLETFVYAVCVILVCYDLVIDAAAGFLKDRRLDENILILLAVIGVFAAGAPVHGAAAVLLFKATVLTGVVLTERYGLAVGGILDQRPEAASLVRDGAIARTPTGKLKAGDVISVSPGERIALDGVVISGESEVDESMLTGADRPRPVGYGHAVTGGTLNLTGVLNIRVSRPFDEGDAARILHYVQSAGRNKSGLEKLLGRIRRIYTPAVAGAAVLTGLLIPLIGALPFLPWLMRGLTLLMLSTLYATTASVTLAYFAGIGGAAVKGIVFKGDGYLDTLARATSVVFSKTGTLTAGRFEVTDVNTYGVAPERLLTMAAYAELNSGHPMARAIVAASKGVYDRFRVSDFREYPGLGVEAEVSGVLITVGNGMLMERLGITPDLSHTEQSVVYVAVNGKYAGRILLSDSLRPDAKKAVRDLHLLGVDRIVIFTGDKKAAAAETAGMLGITEVYAESLPEDKLKRLQTLLEMQLPGDRLVFVGDGIDDAALMKAADIGIVLDGFDTDVPTAEGDISAGEADIVIMTGEVAKVPEAVMLARGANIVARQNMMLLLAARGLVILLTLLGLLPVWGAMLAMTAAAAVGLLHATRAAGFRRGAMRRSRVRSRARLEDDAADNQG